LDVDLENPRALAVRLYPDSAETKEKWKRWLGCARVTYNAALALLHKARKDGKKPDRSAIKTEVTKAERVAAAGKGWLAETPISIRGAAVNELWKNLGSALAGRKARQKKSKRKERKERPVSLKWKRKCRWERESVTIETTKMDFQAGPRSHVTIFGDPVRYSDSREVTDFLEGLAKRSERLPKNTSHTGTRYNKDCRLLLDRRDHSWWLVVPYDASELELPRAARARKRRQLEEASGQNTPQPNREWVALDAGVRVKATFYSPEGVAGEIGSDFKDHTRSTAEKYAALQARWACLVSKGRKRMGRKEKRQAGNARRGMARCKLKLDAIQRQHHYLAAGYLLDNFQRILLPEFRVSEMVQKKDEYSGKRRRIRKVTVKDMMGYGHYKFRKRLEARGGSERVFLCLENHTTKTCGLCLTQNHGVGSAKQFKCVNQACGLVAGRDVHAARNILLKHVMLPQSAGASQPLKPQVS
jgi:transposase